MDKGKTTTIMPIGGTSDTTMVAPTPPVVNATPAEKQKYTQDLALYNAVQYAISDKKNGDKNGNNTSKDSSNKYFSQQESGIITLRKHKKSIIKTKRKPVKKQKATKSVTKNRKTQNTKKGITKKLSTRNGKNKRK